MTQHSRKLVIEFLQKHEPLSAWKTNNYISAKGTRLHVLTRKNTPISHKGWSTLELVASDGQMGIIGIDEQGKKHMVVKLVGGKLVVIDVKAQVANANPLAPLIEPFLTLLREHGVDTNININNVAIVSIFFMIFAISVKILHTLKSFIKLAFFLTPLYLYLSSNLPDDESFNASTEVKRIIKEVSPETSPKKSSWFSRKIEGGLNSAKAGVITLGSKTSITTHLKVFKIATVSLVTGESLNFLGICKKWIFIGKAVIDE